MAGLVDSNALAQWQHLYEDRRKVRTPQADWHMQQLQHLGLPTRHHENWKYTFTPLEKLLAHRFITPPALVLTQAMCASLALNIDALRLVFVDGVFCPLLSDSLTGSGFTVAVNNQRASLPVAVQPEAFLHLTEGLSQSVTHLHVAPGVQTSRVLVLMHISSGSRTDDEMNSAHYRHHLVLDPGARATVIEHYVSLDEAAHFTGTRLTVEIAASAVLEHIKLAFENPHSYHFAHNDLRIAQDASVHSSSFLLGARLLRHNTSTRLDGVNTTLRLNSLALPVNHEVCDSRTWLAHNKGYCNSRQLHKTIVRDRARAVFNGLINVAPYAVKTDGQMTNNNLLLGRLAEVDTKPQLEIYADDVKCSHGATVGRIDDEQMFYLRSRGISEQTAQRMIITAFAAELTQALSDEDLKRQVLERIHRRFAGDSACVFP